MSVEILKIVNWGGSENCVFGVKVAKIVSRLKNVSVFVVGVWFCGGEVWGYKGLRVARDCNGAWGIGTLFRRRVLGVRIGKKGHPVLKSGPAAIPTIILTRTEGESRGKERELGWGTMIAWERNSSPRSTRRSRRGVGGDLWRGQKWCNAIRKYRILEL